MIFCPVQRFCNDLLSAYVMSLKLQLRYICISAKLRGCVKKLFKNFRLPLKTKHGGAPEIHKCTISGAATVRIAIPTNMQSNLIFHYNLKFYESEGDTYDGVSLKRFVMQVKRSTFYILLYIGNIN